jgi:hypothetical protein
MQETEFKFQKRTTIYTQALEGIKRKIQKGRRSPRKARKSERERRKTSFQK